MRLHGEFSASSEFSFHFPVVLVKLFVFEFPEVVGSQANFVFPFE
jgi:hypothetical protein